MDSGFDEEQKPCLGLEQLLPALGLLPLVSPVAESALFSHGRGVGCIRHEPEHGGGAILSILLGRVITLYLLAEMASCC